MSLLAQVEAAYTGEGKLALMQPADEDSSNLSYLWSPTLGGTPKGTSVGTHDAEDAKTIVTITSAESASPNRSTSTAASTAEVATPVPGSSTASFFSSTSPSKPSPGHSGEGADAELPDYARDLLSSFSDTSAGPETLSLHDYAPSSASRHSFAPSSVAPTSPLRSTFGVDRASQAGTDTPRVSVAFPERASAADGAAPDAAPPSKRRPSLASDMTLLSRPSLSPSALPPDLNGPRARLRTQSLNPLRNSLHWPGSAEQKRASAGSPATSPRTGEFGEAGPGPLPPPRTRKRSALALAVGAALGVGMAVGSAAASAEMPRSPDTGLHSSPVTPRKDRRKAGQGGAEGKVDEGAEKGTNFGRLGLATVKGKA